MLILIVEDDRDLAANIAAYLNLFDIDCDFAFNGQAALTLCEEQEYDIILLDIMMPKMDGYTVCETLKKKGVNTPVIILTSCDDDEEQLKGFMVGADDYISKPCSLPILKARIDVIQKRKTMAENKIQIGDLEVDLIREQATRQESKIKLSPTAFKLLAYLAQKSPDVVSREELEAHLWPNKTVKASNFNVHVHAIRAALDKPFDTAMLHTLVGAGLAIR
ncbi:MAG: response regulator transcription factor [Cellvibrionaceae bacterium]|nr:response regulator transcription factor [Cellvibrionaceae bacterium]